MVFFTSVIIVAILYYLQAEGLIYAIVIAVVAELVNIFMTQTLTKSVEKKMGAKFGKIIDGYKATIKSQKKTIKELEKIQEDSVQKLYKANQKIKEYEEKLEEQEGMEAGDGNHPPAAAEADAKKAQADEKTEMEPAKKAPETDLKKVPEEFIDLPSGSNRKKRSV